MFDIQRFNDDFGLLSVEDKAEIGAATYKSLTETDNVIKFSESAGNTYLAKDNLPSVTITATEPGRWVHINTPKDYSIRTYLRKFDSDTGKYKTVIKLPCFGKYYFLGNYDKNNGSSVTVFTNSNWLIDKPKNYQFNFNSFYCVRIDESISDPQACCSYPETVTINGTTYKNDAYGKEPLFLNLTTGETNWGGWEDCDLLPERKLLDTRGTPRNINATTDIVGGTHTEGLDVYDIDVMVRFPFFYTGIQKNGNIVDLIFSRAQIEGYVANSKAFNVDGTVYKYFYHAAYASSGNSSQLRSLSGKTPYNGTVVADLPGAVKGSKTDANWFPATWYQRMYIMQMLILLSKRLDLQNAFGKGNYSGTRLQTGVLDSQDCMFYGTSDPSKPIKTLYIENLWGNQQMLYSGLYKYSGYVYAKNIRSNYFNGGTGAAYYNSRLSLSSSNALINKAKVLDNTFFPVVDSPPNVTNQYYCDYGYQSTSSGFWVVGGYPNGTNGDVYGGPFSFDFASSANCFISYTDSNAN